MFKKLKFESNKEKYYFFAILGVIALLVVVTFYPSIESHMPQITGNTVTANTITQQSQSTKHSKTPKEYYDMFKCSCCGESIDANCCDMAKQRKEYLDVLLLEGSEEDKVVYEMVKKFGFDILKDTSREQEVRDYIKSLAPANPPKIEIENPRYNFGTISQKDGIVSTLFTIKNTGGSDLIIENMDSSCMCTTASLIYKGQEGPRFGMSMHGENPDNYKLVIPAGEAAQLKVYYDSMAHGKQKEPKLQITREITITSNDPLNFQQKVRIELTQVP